MTNNKHKPSVKFLSSRKNGKTLRKTYQDGLPVKELKLKGNRMGKFHYKMVEGTRSLPAEIYTDNNFRKEISGGYEKRDTTIQSHQSRESISISTETNPPISSFVHKQYVDIPLPLSNPVLTDESCSIVSDGRDLNEIITLELKTDRCSKLSNEEKNVSNVINEKACCPDDEKVSPDNSNKNERRCTSQIITAIETSCNGLENEMFRKRESNTAPARSSTYSKYTPSTPPLFLSDEIYELPKGISPSKALLELRQTFCENIRKETEQLEFDLQELYLKKKIHQR